MNTWANSLSITKTITIDGPSAFTNEEPTEMQTLDTIDFVFVIYTCKQNLCQSINMYKTYLYTPFLI